MQFTTIFTTLMAAVAVSAAVVPDVEARTPDLGAIPELQARDVCGAGYGADQRRTNSPCKSSNGDRHFCGCDRTGVVRIILSVPRT